MESLILASGSGTRLQPLTITKAKGLLQYKGKPIISHIVDKIPRDIDMLISINKKLEADFRQWRDRPYPSLCDHLICDSLPRTTSRNERIESRA